MPTALLAPIRPAGRLFFFFAGLLFMVLVEVVLPPFGPHNPMIFLPVLGLFLAVDAILAELIVRLARWSRSRLRPPPYGIGDY